MSHFSKQVTFYVLSNKTQGKDELSAQENLACDLTAQAWREGKKVLLVCNDEAQAFRLDEALWQRSPEEFVPHNLSGELTRTTPPIEITWGNKRNSQMRQLLINLQTEVPSYFNSFNQIIDFVPSKEEEKVPARERYKFYRQQGWQLQTEQV